MVNKFKGLSLKTKVISCVCAGALVSGTAAAVAGTVLDNGIEQEEIIEALSPLSGGWPSSFDVEEYDEPEFVDSASRTNNAFNVEDFDEQGKNGWFYRYGDYNNPKKSKRLESFDGEKYFQVGVSGMEVKKNFIHTGEGASPILEWRAAKAGNVNIKLTYVKDVNGDKNPNFPDGVCLNVFNGDELIFTKDVTVSTTREEVVEVSLEDIPVEKLSSLYFTVAAKNNNAYDGGALYVAINDVNYSGPKIQSDATRTNNNANCIDDFGTQGKNGWMYMCGNKPGAYRLVSSKGKDGFMDFTSPNLAINETFIHPAINSDAVLGWQPAVDGTIEVRMNYSKYEQNDGNPSWPDGTSVRMFHNEKLLYKEDVASIHGDGHDNKVDIKLNKLQVKKGDVLTFDINCYKNNAWDGGRLEMSITDASVVTLPAGEDVRTNTTSLGGLNSVKQGTDGWWFMEGTTVSNAKLLKKMNDDETAYLSTKTSGLEMKKDFVHPGENKGAIYKWVVYEDGKIDILGGYTKYGQNDVNPDWPDGVNLSIYKNDEEIQNSDVEAFRGDGNDNAILFAFEQLEVKKGDVISFIISPVLPEEKDVNKGKPEEEKNDDNEPNDVESDKEKTEESNETEEADDEQKSEETESDTVVESESEKADTSEITE